MLSALQISQRVSMSFIWTTIRSRLWNWRTWAATKTSTGLLHTKTPDSFLTTAEFLHPDHIPSQQCPLGVIIQITLTGHLKVAGSWPTPCSMWGVKTSQAFYKTMKCLKFKNIIWQLLSDDLNIYLLHMFWQHMKMSSVRKSHHVF